METTQRILVYLGLICGLLQHTKSSSSVRTECTQNCNIAGTEIRGREGKNITMKYTVTFTDSSQFDYELQYDGNRIFQFLDNTDTEVNVRTLAKNPRFNIDRNSIVKTGDDITFNIVLLSLDKAANTGKTLVSRLNWHNLAGVSQPTTTSTLQINVYYGPDVVEGMNSTYSLLEGGPGINVNLVINGNPAPVLRNVNTNQTYSPNLISAGSYRYTVNFNGGRNECDVRQTLTASVDNDASSRKDLATVLKVIFTPDTPAVVAAIFKRDNCLEASWGKVASGNCPVTYTAIYTYHNGTWNTSTTNLNIRPCFPFSTSINGSVVVKATVGDRSSGFSPRALVLEEPDPTIPPTTPVAVTPDSDKATGLKNDNLEWYYILIIVAAILLAILIVTCIVLCCTKRLSCWGCCYEKTKPSPVNGISNPDYEAEFEMKHSVRHLSNAAGLTRPADRDKSDKTKEGDYVDVRTMEKPKEPAPVSSTDYAELGPGGRAGEKPKVVPSFYAQVNTDDAYYPPLNPENKAPPVYAVSSKVRPDGGPNPQGAKSGGLVEPVYVSNSNRPPSEYEDDEINPITV